MDTEGIEMYLALAILSAVAFTAGDVFMKHSDGLTRLAPTLFVYLFFAGGASLQARAMQSAELSVTSVIVVGLEAALAVGVGMLCFEEGLSLSKATGILLVVAGIVALRCGGD
jgi:multidrug transporter EmrE-like cation transporter